MSSSLFHVKKNITCGGGYVTRTAGVLKRKTKLNGEINATAVIIETTVIPCGHLILIFLELKPLPEFRLSAHLS